MFSAPAVRGWHFISRNAMATGWRFGNGRAGEPGASTTNWKSCTIRSFSIILNPQIWLPPPCGSLYHICTDPKNWHVREICGWRRVDSRSRAAPRDSEQQSLRWLEGVIGVLSVGPASFVPSSVGAMRSARSSLRRGEPRRTTGRRSLPQPAQERVIGGGAIIRSIWFKVGGTSGKP